MMDILVQILIDNISKNVKRYRREKIDCIITKDLSRFGRNHIDTG